MGLVAIQQNGGTTIDLIKVERVPTTVVPGTCATVIQHEQGSDKREMLLDILHAAGGDLLYSMANALTWAECESYVLAWGSTSSGVVQI